MSHGGKGSAPRPKSVDPDTFANNWDAIFNKKKKDEIAISDIIHPGYF